MQGLGDHSIFKFPRWILLSLSHMANAEGGFLLRFFLGIVAVAGILAPAYND